MASSGTVTFQMTVDEVVAEAFEQLGVVPSALTGYDLKTARRSLSLLLQEFGNRNIWAYQQEKDSFPTVAATAEYTLDTNTNDVRSMTIRVNGNDVDLTRYTYGEYARIPNKAQAGRPIYAYIDRQRDSTLMTLWPVPDAVYTVSFEKLRKIQDVGTYTNTLDIPTRVLPAIIAGLAYKLALKRPNLVGDRLAVIKGEAEQQLGLAVEEDQDRVSTFLSMDMRRRR